MRPELDVHFGVTLARKALDGVVENIAWRVLSRSAVAGGGTKHFCHEAGLEAKSLTRGRVLLFARITAERASLPRSASRMASTGRALSRLSRTLARVDVSRGAARGVPCPRPLAWALTRFESSNAAARARALEDAQVRAAGAALDAIEPGGETARVGVGDGAPSSPAGMFPGTYRNGVGANAPDAGREATTRGASSSAWSSSSASSSGVSAAGVPPFPHPYPSAVVYVDTLAMARALERSGMDSRVAEGVAREVASATRDATGPLASRAEFERLTVALGAKVELAEREMKSRQREAENSSRHSVDVVTSEIEKLRSELRFAHDKIAASQKLDLNLERGRLRDDLRRQDDKMGAVELRLDREISSMKTTIEAAKNDVIKYSIGAIMSTAAVGMSLMRLLM